MSAGRWIGAGLVLAIGVTAAGIGTWAMAVELRTKDQLGNVLAQVGQQKAQARRHEGQGTYPKAPQAAEGFATGIAWPSIAQHVQPATVMIEAEFPPYALPSLYRFPGERPTWFRQAVAHRQQLHTPPARQLVGAGVVIGPHRVLTASHVVTGLAAPVNLYARFPDGRRSFAMVETLSPTYDAAMLYIEDGRAAGVPIADRSQVQAGMPVLTIGAPNGEPWQQTEGVVTTERHHSREPAGVLLPVWEITVPLADGNSGGPVLSPAGEVIGIAAYSMFGGQYAIPADLALASITEARKARGPGVYCPAKTTGGTKL